MGSRLRLGVMHSAAVTATLRRRITDRTTVVFHRNAPNAAVGGHDQQSKAVVAARLAELLDADYGGDFDASRRYDGNVFIVPSDTLTSADARRLGVRSAGDVFGGVVPHPFVATKVISHPLIGDASTAPAGWLRDHGRRVAAAVLPGWSAFSASDARQAAAQLLQQGGCRIKNPAGVGGVGQWVVDDAAGFESWLAGFGADRVAQHGIVLERDLQSVATYSVGQVQVGDLVASYHGTQSLTRNHHGQLVYGGSDLHLVRGGFDALLHERLSADVRTAVEQTLVYHRAAEQCYRGFYASRCNYDVAQGVDAAGARLSGVLEQSWRIGGASGAEVAALHALKADPALRRVHASTHEIYGGTDAPPPGAWVVYDGVDAHVGRLTKYVLVGPHVDA